MSRRRNTKYSPAHAPPPPSPEAIAAQEARVAEISAAASAAKAIYDRGPLAVSEGMFESPQTRVDQVAHFARSRTLFRIPNYQRESVWTAEQARHYVSDVFCGNRPAGVFVFRERSIRYKDNPNSVRVLDVLDGQQRLLAMGAPCFRGTVEDIANLRAQPVFGPAPWFDFEATDYDKSWRATPADAQHDLSRLLDENIRDHTFVPSCVPLFYLGHHAWRKAVRKDGAASNAPLEMRAAHASSVVSRINLLLIVLPPSMPLDALRLWFRAINSGGTPMSAEDLERALAADGD
jgi:hypothetical protein